jgi:hypothetical protein
MMKKTTPEESPAGEADGRDTGHVARRVLISGAAAASVGAAASLVVSSSPASATQGDPVIAGASNTATYFTLVSCESAEGFVGQTFADGFPGLAGLDSSSGGGYGVNGNSTYGTGVYGTSTNATGISGDASAAGYAGVYGTSAGGDGIWGNTTANGFSGTIGVDNSTGGGNGVAGYSTSGTGVYGTSTNATGISGDASAAGYAGVYGTSAGGDGIWGNTTADAFSGIAGVDNSTGGGNGVAGYSTSGTGVLASSTKGTALYVDGSATFSMCGVAQVAGTASHKADTVVVSGVPLAASSLVLATPQGAIDKVAVEGVVIDVAAGSFTIHLTKEVATSLSVAWFVIETAPSGGASADQEGAKAARRHQPAVMPERPAGHRPALRGAAPSARYRPAHKMPKSFAPARSAKASPASLIRRSPQKP